jgi:hypothetical protein
VLERNISLDVARDIKSRFHANTERLVNLLVGLVARAS